MYTTSKLGRQVPELHLSICLPAKNPSRSLGSLWLQWGFGNSWITLSLYSGSLSWPCSWGWCGVRAEGMGQGRRSRILPELGTRGTLGTLPTPGPGHPAGNPHPQIASQVPGPGSSSPLHRMEEKGESRVAELQNQAPLIVIHRYLLLCPTPRPVPTE